MDRLLTPQSETPKYFLALCLLLLPVTLVAAEWPPALVNSTFQSCNQVGGESQCQCVVIRLQEKFTFEDMRLAMHNKLAKEALNQMIRTFNMKCLDDAFKKETFSLERVQKPTENGVNQFR